MERRQLTRVILLLMVCAINNGQIFGQRRNGNWRVGGRGGTNRGGRSDGNSFNDFAQDCGGGFRDYPPPPVTSTDDSLSTTTTTAMTTSPDGTSMSTAVNTTSSLPTSAAKSPLMVPSTLSIFLPSSGENLTSSTTAAPTSINNTPTTIERAADTTINPLPSDPKTSTTRTGEEVTTTVERSTTNTVKGFLSTSISNVGATGHSLEITVKNATASSIEQTTWKITFLSTPTTISGEPNISTGNNPQRHESSRPWEEVKNEVIVGGAALVGMSLVLLAAIFGIHCCHKYHQGRARVGAYDLKLKEKVPPLYDTGDVEKKKDVEYEIFRASAPPAQLYSQLAPPSYSMLSVREAPPKYCWNQADLDNRLKDKTSIFYN